MPSESNPPIFSETQEIANSTVTFYCDYTWEISVNINAT